MCAYMINSMLYIKYYVCGEFIYIHIKRLIFIHVHILEKKLPSPGIFLWAWIIEPFSFLPLIYVHHCFLPSAIEKIIQHFSVGFLSTVTENIIHFSRGFLPEVIEKIIQHSFHVYWHKIKHNIHSLVPFLLSLLLTF